MSQATKKQCKSSSQKECLRNAVVKGYCSTCYSNQWQKLNRAKVNEGRDGYWKHRFRNDPQYHLKSKIRASTANAIHRDTDDKNVKYLGCTPLEFKLYLAAQMTPEMTFENYGKIWELDHRRPLATFDLTDPTQLVEAANYSNVRPLLIIENRMQKKA